MALLKYGGLVIADQGAARLTWGRELLLNEAGVGIRWRARVDATELGLACNGPGDAAAKAALITSILAVPGLDLEFDGVRFVSGTSTFGGNIQTVYGPVWSDRPGANGYTFLSYRAGWAWEYPVAGEFLLRSFEETVTVTGGAPTRVGFRPVNAALGIVQTTTLATIYEATQVGSQVGLYDRIPPPGPIWPLAEADPRVVSNASGRRVGSARVDFLTSWSYRFVSAIPLTPTPNEWL